MATVHDCLIIDLPRITDPAGNITPVESNISLPFEIKRIFYIYDIPAGESRGAHAHKECHQFAIAISGSFEIHLDDGVDKRTILLNRPFKGLHIPPGIWASEQEFSSGAVCLVITSHPFDENDYIRQYEEYMKTKELSH